MIVLDLTYSSRTKRPLLRLLVAHLIHHARKYYVSLPIVRYGHYLKPCEHRVEHATANSVAICGIVREKIGVDHPVSPKVCAECMLHGTQNIDYIKTIMTGILIEVAINAKLGFYENEDEDKVSDIFKFGFLHTSDHDKLCDLLVECVALGRISAERARTLVMEKQDEKGTD